MPAKDETRTRGQSGERARLSCVGADRGRNTKSPSNAQAELANAADKLVAFNRWLARRGGRLPLIEAFTAQILAGEIIAQIERGAAMLLRPAHADERRPGHLG
jgi:hypothetical protein